MKIKSSFEEMKYMDKIIILFPSGFNKLTLVYTMVTHT